MDEVTDLITGDEDENPVYTTEQRLVYVERQMAELWRQFGASQYPSRITGAVSMSPNGYTK